MGSFKDVLVSARDFTEKMANRQSVTTGDKRDYKCQKWCINQLIKATDAVNFVLSGFCRKQN